MTLHAGPAWFWARLVFATATTEAFRRRNPRVELWRNLMLIRASSIDEAIQKAETIGREEAGNDDNSLKVNGAPGEMRFLGIDGIGLIHDDLSDGAEILWTRKLGLLQKAKRGIPTRATLKSALIQEVRRQGLID